MVVVELTQTAAALIGIGLFTDLTMRRRWLGGVALVLVIGIAVLMKTRGTSRVETRCMGRMAAPWQRSGTGDGAFALMLLFWLPRRPNRSGWHCVADWCVDHAAAADFISAKAPLSIFSWNYGHLLHLNGLTHTVILAWPFIATAVLLWRFRRTGQITGCQSPQSRKLVLRRHLKCRHEHRYPTTLIDGPAGPLEIAFQQPATAATSALALICHPHPVHGGTMDNKVVQTLAKAFLESGLRHHALQFSWRGQAVRAVRRRHRRNRGCRRCARVGASAIVVAAADRRRFLFRLFRAVAPAAALAAAAIGAGGAGGEPLPAG